MSDIFISSGASVKSSHFYGTRYEGNASVTALGLSLGVTGVFGRHSDGFTIGYGLTFGVDAMPFNIGGNINKGITTRTFNELGAFSKFWNNPW